ncbi:LacI family DNA-binding transcriptional regulator [Paenibacillus aestuarii]|uniref:LacI family DNA-binding transcriptional regulator n=1 Tax=Paenibacillus aestuarii TaxID=516965 RepID=A0ABW0K6Q4_9BACL|nr:LacI family DNA-binding transcriptional regulator [Paenibacillus aestuarii]
MSKLTIKDIAREAGVSTATISRVLNNSGYVSQDVKQQVLEVIRKFNYQPNAIARSLKQEKSRSIGIVLPDMTNPYFMKIARAIQHRCFQEGYHLLFVDTEENPDKEREALDFLTEKRIEALILAGTGANRDQIQAISDSGIHVILIDRRFSNLKLDTVTEDNIYAAKSAIEFLLEKNHQQIGMIHGPQSISTAKERKQGATLALQEAGITLTPELVFEGDYSRESGIAAIRHFCELPERPTAIFSTNNEMTFGIYLGLQEMGIPLDSIEIVSFGNLEFSSLFEHQLTVIMQNPQELGDTAGDLLIRRLSGGEEVEAPQNRILMPRLIQLSP